MKTSGQFQKQSALPSQPIPLTQNLFQSRPFRDPNAQAIAQPAEAIDNTVRMKGYLDSNGRPAWWSTVSFGPQPVAGVQTKLTVGAPNDVYEQEADRVADQVMSMPDSATQQPVQREAMPEDDEVQTKPIAASITPLVQREAMPEEEEIQTKAIASIQREEMPEEEESLQMKSLGSIQREDIPEEEEIQTKPALQRSPDGSLQAGSAIESRLHSSQGGGSPLSDDVRSFMEPRFGADFSQVRVHTGNEAVQMNRDLNAQAFTHKQDVYFGAGKTPANDALTAHELTHVVQQAAKVQPVLSPMIQRQKKKKKKAKATGISINHSVTLFPQPTTMTCWSAAATMILGDRSVDSGGAPTNAEYGLKTTDENIETFAQAYGFTMHYPQTWTVNGLAELLRSRPLWVGGNMPGLHAVVVGGMSGDGTVENTSITIYNPWPPGVGKVETLSYGAWINQFPMATMYVLHQ